MSASLSGSGRFGDTWLSVEANQIKEALFDPEAEATYEKAENEADT